MSSFVFQGSSALTLDVKGRITVPARHREVLAAIAAGQLTVTKHPNRCLLVFPRPAWESFRDKREVMLLGMGQRLELWDAARLSTHEDQVIDQGMPDALKDHVF